MKLWFGFIDDLEENTIIATAPHKAELFLCLVEPECLTIKIQCKPQRALFAVRQGSALVGVETEGRLAAIVEGDFAGLRAAHLVVEGTPFFAVGPEASAAILFKCKESHIVACFKAYFPGYTVNNLVQNIILFCRQNHCIE